jgi:hypothetical protein
MSTLAASVFMHIRFLLLPLWLVLAIAAHGENKIVIEKIEATSARKGKVDVKVTGKLILESEFAIVGKLNDRKQIVLSDDGPWPVVVQHLSQGSNGPDWLTIPFRHAHYASPKTVRIPAGTPANVEMTFSVDSLVVDGLKFADVKWRVRLSIFRVEDGRGGEVFSEPFKLKVPPRDARK